MARCIPSTENRDASVVYARKQVCHKALWEGNDMTAHQFASSGQLPPNGSSEFAGLSECIIGFWSI